METIKKYWILILLFLTLIFSFIKRKSIRKKVRRKVVTYKKIKNAYGFMRQDMNFSKLKSLKNAYRERKASGRDGNVKMW